VRDDRERLEDILEAIERIEKYAVRGPAALDSDELLQTWVVHHLMIVGEACRALSGEFRTGHPEEVWVLAAGLRNVIVHEYFGMDLEVVWRVIERDLPALKQKVQEILAVEGFRPRPRSTRIGTRFAACAALPEIPVAPPTGKRTARLACCVRKRTIGAFWTTCAPPRSSAVFHRELRRNGENTWK
jgi:uncharacterized protein with HEPN domain